MNDDSEYLSIISRLTREVEALSDQNQDLRDELFIAKHQLLLTPRIVWLHPTLSESGGSGLQWWGSRTLHLTSNSATDLLWEHVTAIQFYRVRLYKEDHQQCEVDMLEPINGQQVNTTSWISSNITSLPPYGSFGYITDPDGWHSYAASSIPLALRYHEMVKVHVYNIDTARTQTIGPIEISRALSLFST